MNREMYRQINVTKNDNFEILSHCRNVLTLILI
jgi:hypothetical protein